MNNRAWVANREVADEASSLVAEVVDTLTEKEAEEDCKSLAEVMFKSKS